MLSCTPFQVNTGYILQSTSTCSRTNRCWLRSLQGVLRSTQIADYNDDDHPSTRHISAHTVERAVAETQPQIPVAVTAPLVAGADGPARSIDPPHTTANTVGSAPAMIAEGSNHDDHPSTRHISADGVERAVAETEPQIPVAVTAPLAACTDVPARRIEYRESSGASTWDHCRWLKPVARRSRAD